MKKCRTSFIACAKVVEILVTANSVSEVITDSVAILITGISRLSDVYETSYECSVGREGLINVVGVCVLALE
jgi:hypothetical protein